MISFLFMNLQEICSEIPVFLLKHRKRQDYIPFEAKKKTPQGGIFEYFKPTDRRDGVICEDIMLEEPSYLRGITNYSMEPTDSGLDFKPSSTIRGLYSKPREPIDGFIRRMH